MLSENPSILAPLGPLANAWRSLLPTRRKLRNTPSKTRGSRGNSRLLSAVQAKIPRPCRAAPQQRRRARACTRSAAAPPLRRRAGCKPRRPCQRLETSTMDTQTLLGTARVCATLVTATHPRDWPERGFALSSLNPVSLQNQHRQEGHVWLTQTETHFGPSISRSDPT